MLQEHNIKIDWSRDDLELRQMICAGSTVNMCNFCSSTLRKSSMCPNSRGYQNSKIQPPYQDKYGRDILMNKCHQLAPETEKAATPCPTWKRLFGHRSRKFTSFRCCRFNQSFVQRGIRHYLKFLQLQRSTWSHFQLPPVSENLLMRFIAFCI
ncbi:unnamed protein product [Mytilus coruscus]|uniref:Uncharacterized protein n=1 Tax=Mytilus coruscus TaxID=42192 RepID=A0A6J8AKG4_MYTCO|nr:unnamed protein product [Mytilus coruscus]